MIIVAGIGPGSQGDITPAVRHAVEQSDVIIGYKYYFQFIIPWVKPGAECIDTGMKKEKDRANIAFDHAEQGKQVLVISSGDAGIYGMAPLIYEMKIERISEVEVEVLPGISAFQKAAAVLGAPIGHDMCIISLSDLMTSWELIEKRIYAAAYGDFVTAIYNPKSKGRYWQLYRLQELFLEHRQASTPVGVVRQAGREDQSVEITTLEQFDPEVADMFTMIIIGNSQTFAQNNMMITPRGYYREQANEDVNKGQSIMMESFRRLLSEMRHTDIDRDLLWTKMHTIHTTADFAMEDYVYADKNAVSTLYNKIGSGELTTIVTDVTMVASGIRKGALERLGIEVKCYLNDERVIDAAKKNGTTRSEEAIHLAVQEHPNALFAFGNAPTAVIKLCDEIRRGKANPIGMVVAPVGFVHVRECKYMAKTFKDIPKVIVTDRRGGSNLAATIVNSILTYDDADSLIPGRDV